MTNVLIGLAFVIAAIAAMVWRTFQDGRVIADGPHRGPVGEEQRSGTAGLAAGDFGSMGIGGGSAGHADGGACGMDGGGGGHC